MNSTSIERDERIWRFLRRVAAIALFVVAILPYPTFLFMRGELVHPLRGLHGSYFLTISLIGVVAGLLILFGRHLPAPRARRYLIFLVVLFLAIEATQWSRYVFSSRSLALWFLDSEFRVWEFSPTMGVQPIPNLSRTVRAAHGRSLKYTHDATRARICQDTEAAYSQAETRIVTVGGSSTYDVGVSDCETWSAKLNDILGTSFKVRNLGVGGHSTAEHVAVAAFRLAQENPKVVVYYIGWNDAQSAHIRPMEPDYSNCHFPMLYQATRVNADSSSFFATTALLKRLLFMTNFITSPTGNRRCAGTAGGEPDPELVSVYRRNIATLVTLTRRLGAEPVFVPQLLNPNRLTADRPYGWIPLIKDRDLPAFVDNLNREMAEQARSLGAHVLEDVLEVPWTDADFVDNGHFSHPGAEKFAAAVARGLRRAGLVQ